jgi:hypothetical protein
MANMKRLEKRLENVEKWLKEFEKGTGPAQTMDNMNFLVGQTRIIGEQMQNIQKQNMELQNILQDNGQMLQEFLEEQDAVLDWQGFVSKKNEERQQNALQESETESLDAQEQAEDGEEVGEGDVEEA